MLADGTAEWMWEALVRKGSGETRKIVLHQ